MLWGSYISVLSSFFCIHLSEPCQVMSGPDTGLCTNVCRPYVVTLPIWTPTFEWHMTKFVVQNRQMKYQLTELELTCIQSNTYIENLLTILGSIVNITIGSAYVIIFTLASSSVCISILIPKLEMAICVIHCNC